MDREMLSPLTPHGALYKYIILELFKDKRDFSYIDIRIFTLTKVTDGSMI